MDIWTINEQTLPMDFKFTVCTVHNLNQYRCPQSDFVTSIHTT